MTLYSYSTTNLTKRLQNVKGTGIAPKQIYKPYVFPYFDFLSVDERMPLQVRVEGSALSSINAGIWYWGNSGSTPRWSQENGSARRIQYSFTRRQWEITNTSITSTYVYMCSSYPAWEFPKDGWKTWNPEWEPVPTTSIITSAFPVLSTHCLANFSPWTVEPPLSLNTDYYFNSATNTFIGYSESSAKLNQIENLFARQATKTINFEKMPNLKVFLAEGNYTEGIIFDSNPVIENIQYTGSRSPKGIVINNNPALHSLNCSSRGTNSIQITNNTRLTSLAVNGPYNSTIVLDNNPNVEILSITHPSLTSIDIDYPNLVSLTLQCSALTNANFINIGSPVSVDIANTNLSGFAIVDSVYEKVSAEIVNSSIISATLKYAALNNLLGRSTASDDAFWFFYKKISYPIVSNSSHEIDALYPLKTIPNGTYITTLPGSAVNVNAPILSGIPYQSQQIRFPSLSGTYTYTGVIRNNRSVFTNPNDYHIIYSSSDFVPLWKVVGPGLSSTTVWLSARASIGDYGNVPSLGWSGPASQGGFWQGDSLSPWYHSTSVYSTSMLLFSGIRFEGSEGRYHIDLTQKFNPNFYWKDLDFSGIVYPSYPTHGNDANSRAGCLVSPIHFTFSNHWGPRTNEEVTIVHRDGTRSTRTVLSAVQVSGDRGMGILSAPVSACAYKVGINSFFNKIEKSTITNFLYGPTQYGKVGYATPVYYSGDSDFVGGSYIANNHSTLYPQITSIPASLWHGERLVGGDSGSPYWYVNNNELVLIGTESGGVPSGSTFWVYNTMNQMMTAMSMQFFGSGTNYHTLSVYNFEA